MKKMLEEAKRGTTGGERSQRVKYGLGKENNLQNPSVAGDMGDTRQGVDNYIG